MDWPVLVREHEFILTKNQAEYDLPSDFDRIIANTSWDRVDSRPVTALSPSQWQEWKSGLVQAEVWKQWRIKRHENTRKIVVNPTPSTTQCEYECRDGTKTRVGLAYEYISNAWATTTTGDPISTLATQTDIILLPDDVVEADFKWRWLRSLGRSYADEKFEAEQLTAATFAQDGTPSTITAHGSRHLDMPNIPETNVGLT